MTPSVTLLHPGKRVVPGWRYLWLKYVLGFDHSQHCARCLIGPYSKRIRRDMPIGESAKLDEHSIYNYLYLCGVAERGGWAANLHIPMCAKEGSAFQIRASTGTVFEVRDAELVPFQSLPDGFDGRSKGFTTCRNWQFGVSLYGLPPKQQ